MAEFALNTFPFFVTPNIPTPNERIHASAATATSAREWRLKRPKQRLQCLEQRCTSRFDPARPSRKRPPVGRRRRLQITAQWSEQVGYNNHDNGYSVQGFFTLQVLIMVRCGAVRCTEPDRTVLFFYAEPYHTAGFCVVKMRTPPHCTALHDS